MGESRDDRVDSIRECSGIVVDAGTHQLGRRLRKIMGGLRISLGSEGSVRDLFCMFVCGCERLFAHQGSVFDFGRALWRMGRGTSQLQKSIEFMEISSSRGIPGRSLPHVFPLPSFVTEKGVSRFHFGRMPTTHDERVGHGVNILQAALNMLYGGGQAKVQSV